MSQEGFEEFESELGNVAVTNSHIERENRESDRWKAIKEEFSTEELVDKAHFSNIDSLGFRPDSMLPHLLLKVKGEWRRLFFCEDENAYECFKYLRYRWNSFCQNH